MFNHIDTSMPGGRYPSPVERTGMAKVSKLDVDNMFKDIDAPGGEAEAHADEPEGGGQAEVGHIHLTLPTEEATAPFEVDLPILVAPAVEKPKQASKKAVGRIRDADAPNDLDEGMEELLVAVEKIQKAAVALQARMAKARELLG